METEPTHVSELEPTYAVSGSYYSAGFADSEPLVPKTDRFLEMAMGVALTSKCKMRHGALVVKHGRILGASPNLYKNSPRYVEPQYSSVHAEIAALRRARWPKKATVYVARVNGTGDSRLSKPCPNCQAVLDELKCKVIWTVS